MGLPPWKNAIFRLLELLVFVAYKGVFSFKNIVRDIFLCYIAEKKKLEKGPFLDQNHGLICLEKSQFFGFLNLFFYSLKGFIFVLEYRKRHFPGLYCLKKSWKNGHFWTKAMG